MGFFVVIWGAWSSSRQRSISHLSAIAVRSDLLFMVLSFIEAALIIAYIMHLRYEKRKSLF